MKSFIAIFVISPLILLACGCNNHTISPKEYENLLQQSCLLIPDTLLTSEQLSLKIQLYDYFYANITVINNEQKILVSRRQFERSGIPSCYYDILEYQTMQNNNAIKKWINAGFITKESMDMEAMLQEAKERWRNTERPLLISLLNR